MFLITSITFSLLVSGCGHLSEDKEAITIQGEVRRPGVYFIKNKLAYIVVVMGARGYTPNADNSKVIIDRGSKSFMLDMSTPKEKPGPFLAEQFKIQGGDVITVPKKQ